MKKALLLMSIGAFTLTKAPTNNLIVLLDFGQSEERQRLGAIPAMTEAGTMHPSTSLGAITSTALPAIYQQVAPIMMSKSLLKSILTRKMIFKDFLEKDVTELWRLYQHQPITRAPSLSLFKQHCIYALNMYKQIRADLSKILKTGSKEELREALNHLTSKTTYLEAGAPRSLHVYSQRQSLSEALHRELQVYMICFLAPLENYLIKDVSPEVVLLVPHSITKEAPYTPSSTITTHEKRWGLKLNHLKDIAVSELLKDTPCSFGLPLSSVIQNVMVTTQEGSSATWTIYLAGHGLPIYPERQEVAALEKLQAFYAKQLQNQTNQNYRTQNMLKRRLKLIESRLVTTNNRLNSLPATHERVLCSTSCKEFQQTLAFFNSQIDTSLLYYTCCFAGGEHLDVPYRNKTFSYDIIVGSVSDAESFQDPIMLLIPPYTSYKQGNSLVVEGISQASLDPKNKSLALRTSLHFDRFFEEAKKPTRNGSYMAQLLHPYTTIENGAQQQYHENIAHLRPAGTNRFTVLSTDAIHTVPQSGSSIPESSQVVFLKEKQHGPLKLNKPVTSIISLLPGTACHMVASLLAPSISLSELADSCLTIPSLSSSKVFYIKKMEGKRDSLLPFFGGSKTILHDVIIARNVPTSDGLQHTTKTSIYYTDEGGTCWHIPVRNGLGSASRTSGAVAHGELITLFPELKATLTHFVKATPTIEQKVAVAA